MPLWGDIVDRWQFIMTEIFNWVKVKICCQISAFGKLDNMINQRTRVVLIQWWDKPH
nr:MAG TPA: hypothetical protein [Caudoviricetes sp.]